MSILNFGTPNKSFRWLMAELSVVVLGILIAFQIEEWRTQRSERFEERTALEAMARDLQSDIEQIDGALAGLQTMLRGVTEFVHQVEQAENISPEKLAQAYADLTIITYWVPNAPTYLGLRERSRLSIISSAELQAQLYEYYEQKQPFMREWGFDIEEARSRVNEQNYLDVYHSPLGSQSTDNTLVVRTTRPDLSPMDITIVLPIEEIPRSSALMSTLGAYGSRLNATEFHYEDSKRIARGLIESIRLHLAIL